jgi:acyl transferase domain-containing protein
MKQDGQPSLTPLQRAFLALEDAQARLAQAEAAAREPIAVIGLGCRVPGGANDAASFWKLLAEGVDAIGPMPADRWDIEALFDADPATPGRIATRSGGFIEGIDRFDAGFFGIAPREAQGMDPQQRLLLEVAWEALEHAGTAPDRLERSRTGVFVGVCSSDYTYLQLKSGDAALLDAHFTSGIAHSVFSGRLSYLLGLQGPSLTIDTACSSSLVAVHLACQSLRSGESRLALAGGVNLMLSPDLYIALSHSRMLAPDGRCKTFDASADGFARAEGCGVVVLKRLRDAQLDGDRVLAVIRGSAVNQDGPSSGLTAPNGPAQEAVVREALQQAGFAPADIGYVEAHGTGTQLGDPLEVHALGAVFAGDRDTQRPLVIGSVKTNIGHLEAAAGVTGLIKLVLSLQHRTIPKHLHFREPSRHIAWDDLPLVVPTEAMPWQPIGGRRIGGVSSFGFSGTNAHVIVEEAPSVEAVPAARRSAGLLALSARDDNALSALAARYAAGLEGGVDAELGDICFTANHGRAHFAHRATIAARSIDELRAGLLALSQRTPRERLRTAHVVRRDAPRIAFLFTGQGAQYPDMAHGLYDGEPVFRTALDRCAEVLATRLERPLLDVLFGADAARLDETARTQPALFAVEYALAELLRSWGITPNIVMGHSIGEYVAACVAGVLPLDDALLLVAERGRLMQSLPAGGAMAAVFASEERVAMALAERPGLVSIAAVNAAEQTVISGVAEAVDALCRRLGDAGVRCQRLAVSHAFHSPLVEPILDAFERAASGVRFAVPRLRLVSNVTGRLADPGEIVQPSYWRRHLRGAVRFGDGLSALATLAPDCIVEVGPHPTLLGFASSVFGEAAPALIPTLRKGRDDREQMHDALASLYLGGVSPNWLEVGRGVPRRIVDLPSYPFQRERHWFQARRPTAAPARGRVTGHPLLGTRLRTAGSEVIFESMVAADTPPFVREHRVQEHVVMPATVYLDTLLAAAVTLLDTERACVEDLTVQEALLLDDSTPRSLQLVCGGVCDGVVPATLRSVADDGAADDVAWLSHVTARLRVDVAPKSDATLPDAHAGCTDNIDVASFYAGFQRRGLDFGPAFRALRRLRAGPMQALGEVELAAHLVEEARSHRIHPVLLDGCLQVLAAALADEGDESLFLPIGVGRFVLHGKPGTRCWSHVVVHVGGTESRRADIAVFGEDGALLAELHDVQLKRVTSGALARLGERWLDDVLYETRWQPAPASSPHPISIPALVDDAAGTVEGLRRAAELDAYDAFLPQHEALCADYVVQTMGQLGWQPHAGDAVAAQSLAERLRVAPRHRRLFGRLLEILAEAGHLLPTAQGWTVAHPLPTVEPAPQLSRLHERFPTGAVEAAFTGRVAAELANALRGELDPMQLLFPGGSLDETERLYRDTPTAKFYNGLVAEVLQRATAATPGQRVRILEVGGGTGGTTAHVAPRLPADRVEYTFTDIGPLFVAKARERFAGYPFMRFQTFDLEHEAQGLEQASFDIVIASNVIHATADLRRTLARVRGLLAPGGVLAMLEVTAPQRWFDLTVGLTEGWWAFSDTELRPHYPTLSRERWLTLLGQCGFDQFAALPAVGQQRGALALQSLLLARAASSTVGDWLLFADRAGMAAALATKLREAGGRCTVVHCGDDYAASADAVTLRPAVAADYRRLLADLRRAGRQMHAAVHAWSLDAAQGAASAMLLAQALVSESPTPRLVLVSRGGQQADARDAALDPQQATLWGLAKTLALEHPELRCVCCDLDPAAASDSIEALFAELSQPGSEPQVAWRGGERRVARLARVRRTAASPSLQQPYRLVPALTGSLERFELRPAERRTPGAGEVEIAVEATGLNFKDVLNVLGMYRGDPGPLGGECAGRVAAVGAGVAQLRPGDAVLAVAGGSFASHVIARAEFVQPRPPGVSAEEGAAFPIAFLTAEFCLGHLAKLKAGERVLIHAAAGGVGMAAVQVALRAGANVFATAGSASKRELLRALGVAHVFDSRSVAFADDVLAATDGRGVDVVLNSLAGELVDASFRAIARGGRFVEIGKRGIKMPEQVAALDRDLHYFIVDWGDTAAREPALIGSMLARLVDELRQGRLRALPRHTFGIDAAERAFRFMAQARHHGKIVVRHGAAPVPAIRRDGSYLVTGGLSGLGPLVARWLAERGAGRVVLIGRRGVTAEVAPMLDVLRAQGTAVVAEAVDVADEAALRALLARIRSDGPPLRGVVHSAGVLDDAGLLQQDIERFERVFAPKVRGGAVLDRLTRADPLDFFVLFSSIAAVLGSRGQANHAAANAFLDLLARERTSRGLPGLSINWGAWSDTGAAVDRGVTDRLAAQGIGALNPAQGLLAFERLLGQPRPQVAVLPIEWSRFLEQSKHETTPAFLSELANASRAVAAPAATATARDVDLRAQLAAAPAGRRRALVAAFVRERALRALGLDASRAVDPRTPLGELGLDSLLAVELRNTLSTALSQPLPATLLFDHPTLDALTDCIAALLAIEPRAEAAAQRAASAVSLVDSIEDLSDDEVERLLAARRKNTT